MKSEASNQNPLHNRASEPFMASPWDSNISVDSSISSSESMLDQNNRAIDLMELESADDVDYVAPNMWSKQNIGLYCQYAAVGLLYGSAGTVLPFCAYVKNGEDQVCSNAGSLVFLAWNFKILFAIFTDLYKPFGYKRKSWMIIGWSLSLLVLLILAVVPTSHLSVSGWLGLLMLTQVFVMISDVPSDGYCVQLGRLEPPKSRGTILATGQMCRFGFSMFAGVLQTLFLNGKSTSPPGSTDYWSFGLTMNGYYGLLFALVFVLVIPILYLEEMKPAPPKPNLRESVLTTMITEVGSGGGRAKDKERPDLSALARSQGDDAAHKVDHDNPTFAFFRAEIWEILQNQTTLYLLIYIVGFHTLAGIGNQANTYLQFYIIQLTQNQAGIDSLTSYLALITAIYLFKTYLIRVNWRYTQWMSCVISLSFGLLWLPAYHNSSGTMNAWYTIFVDLDRSFVGGLAQVLYSLSVIELAKPGLEATTYELLVTVGNACLTISSIIGTQLLVPSDAIGCQEEDYTQCPSDSVSIASKDGYFATNGPSRYTKYSLLVFFISAVNASIWVWFLPRNIEQCKEWKAAGEKKGNSFGIGVASLVLSCSMVLYGFVVAFLLLDPSTSCMKIVGGNGC